MALSLRHWILGAALGCAVIAVAYLPPSGKHWGFRTREGTATPERSRLARLEHALRRNQSALRLVMQRDSVLRWVQRVRVPPRTDGRPVFLVDPQVPGNLRRAADSIFAADWWKLQPLVSNIRAGAVILLDTASSLDGLPPTTPQAEVSYLLPYATDGRTCLSVVRIGREAFAQDVKAGAIQSERLWRTLVAGTHLGPCAYYAAFGQPGPAIEAWLLGRGFDLAYEIDWRVAPAPDSRGADTLRSVFGDPFRYWGSLDVTACRGGDVARCRAAVLTTKRRDQAPTGTRGPAVIVPDFQGWGLSDFRSMEFHYLSDLVREVGRDRFGRLWRSPLGVDSAFTANVGLPIGEWTRRWAVERMGETTVGSAVRPAAVILGLLFAGLLVGGVAFYATRRQVA